MGVKRRLGLLAATLVAILGLSGTAARAAATAWSGDAHTAVRLVTAVDRLGPGDLLSAGLEFRFAPGWHGYWRTPGDAGLPPSVEWSGSQNIGKAELSWPAPKRIVVEGLQNAGYEGEILLPVDVTRRNPAAPVVLKAAVNYAACSNICVPYQAMLTLEIPRGEALPSAEAALIAQARSEVPASPANAGIEVRRAEFTGAGPERMLALDLYSRVSPFLRPDLFVEDRDAGLPSAPDVVLSDKGHAARMTVKVPQDGAAGAAILATVTDEGRSAEIRVAEATRPPATASLGIIAALVSALFGGFILNLMPCVLPVLSLKLLSIAQAGGENRRMMRRGLATSALGIVASFVVLAASLVALKAFGLALGWGIQFQQPWFLAVMASVTVLFALSLFDRVSIVLPSSLATALSGGDRSSLPGAFLTGAFATLLATPCSAPFVGTAVGFALARGAGEILAIFLALGLGMSAPYWIVAVLPGATRIVPRPGPWMPALRRVLGWLLFGTAGWLLWVLSSVAGAIVAAVVSVPLGVLIAWSLWVQEGGMRAAPRSQRIARLSLATAPMLLAIAFPASLTAPRPAAPGWQAFDPGAVPGLVAGGKTVLVDVTATWCLTCKVNELAVFGRPEVENRLASQDVVRMRADWSRPDAAIAAFLNSFGRYGIPFDIVYGPKRPDGEPLPELLTPGVVTGALDRAAGA